MAKKPAKKAAKKARKAAKKKSAKKAGRTSRHGITCPPNYHAEQVTRGGVTRWECVPNA